MKATKQTTLTREDWLRQAVAELAAEFTAQAAMIPDKLRVGVGYSFVAGTITKAQASW